jgi:DNA-directed RNA polymerase specialized sigma24 family protein
VSPRTRRRPGDPTLDDALGTPGTVAAEVSDTVPDEPEWLRDAGGDTPERDPTAPLPAGPDPKVLAERRAEREAQILRALNPEQARAVTTTDGPLLILAVAGSGGE